MTIYRGESFLQWLHQAGAIPEHTRRVVIEAEVGMPTKLYVEMFGAAEMLSVEPPAELRGAEIRILEAPPVAERYDPVTNSMIPVEHFQVRGR